MHEPALNLLALSYRLVYNTYGCYLMARLAPSNPMKHVWIGAAIGFVRSMLGLAGELTEDLGPPWHPVLLADWAFPTAWLGGALYRRSRAHRTAPGNRATQFNDSDPLESARWCITGPAALVNLFCPRRLTARHPL